MAIKAKAFKFGDDIDTDIIIPAKYLNTTDEAELASHLMEPERPDFLNDLKDGGIIVAGKNFGCGSSREHAPLAIRGAGVPVVIAESYARIFYRNSFNMGLAILESAEAAKNIDEGDEIEVDLSTGEIKNLSKGQTFRAQPIPEFMQELLAAGGLMNYVMEGKA